MQFLEKMGRFAGRWFAYLILAAAVAGYCWPAAFAFVLPQMPWLLGIIMLGMGMTLRPADFATIARRPAEVGLGLAAQYVIMPLAGFALAVLFRLKPEYAAGVVLLGACPGGTASNVITFLARGDVALSVAMTTASTLAAPVATPIIYRMLAGRWIEVDAFGMFLSILWIILLPVAVGTLLHQVAPRAVRRALPLLPLVSVVGIMLIVAAVVGKSRDSIATMGPLLALVVVIHNGVGLFLGYLAGRLLPGMSEAKRRALSIEVGMQNSGLAVTLATKHLSPESAVPGALFSVWHNISGSLLAAWWARRDRRRQ